MQPHERENAKAEREGKKTFTTLSTWYSKRWEKRNSIKFECRKMSVLSLHHGFFYRNRSNSKGYDLNRNFPDYFKQNTKRTQPETEAVKDWISKIQFLLSGSLHGGALVRMISSFWYCHVYIIRFGDAWDRALTDCRLRPLILNLLQP